MRSDEIEDSIKEAHELSEMFAAIADVLETLLSRRDDDAE